MIYKAGNYSYEATMHWAKFPGGAVPRDAAALDVDAQDRVYVLTRGTPPVVIFDRDGNALTAWGEGQFKGPHGIHVGPDGSVYVADTVRHAVMKFDFEGKLLQVLGNIDKPSSTGFTGFVMPEHYNNGRSYYARMAKLRDFFKTKTRIGGPFNAPCSVFVTPEGEIYVADGYGNVRIHRFSADGTLLLSWGQIGDGPGEFLCPHSVWVDKRGQVWVGDRENYRVQIFDTEGNYLREWNDIPCPSYLFIDDEDRVYMTEALTRSLSIWTIDGRLIARWYNREDERFFPFLSPHYVALDSQGDIYVANSTWAMCRQEMVNELVTKFVRRG